VSKIHSDCTTPCCFYIVKVLSLSYSTFNKNLKCFNMKKNKIIIVTMTLVTVVVFIAISPLRLASQKHINQSVNSIPDEVSKILKNSCATCHDAGNGMAASIWSLSAWDSYSVKKQAKKSKAICNSITEGSMPPSSFRQSHPDKVPSKEQADVICQWANSLQPKK